MRVEDRGNNHPRHERARVSPMEWKNDTYRKARGGYARLLAVSCATCGTHLFSYQKDGPGLVKRLYLDRIYQSNTYEGLQYRAFKDIPPLLCPPMRRAARGTHQLPERTTLGLSAVCGCGHD